MVETTKSAEEILSGAAELIKQYGWRQNDYGDVRRGFCAIGAIRRMANNCEAEVSALKVLSARLGFVYKNSEGSILDWNDASYQKMGTVIAALEGTRKP